MLLFNHIFPVLSQYKPLFPHVFPAFSPLANQERAWRALPGESPAHDPTRASTAAGETQGVGYLDQQQQHMEIWPTKLAIIGNMNHE
jgi:hypothetical protein